jgi:5'-nucleotidase
MNRRRFLHSVAVSAAAMALPRVTRAESSHRIVILHTNDTHSRIDPFPMDGGRLQGLGGVARRATLIRRIRNSNPHVMLLDSGDIFQGTPYFNFFEGEVELRAMSAMRYDAATLGNHEFDNGVSGLVKVLPHANFPFISTNYSVADPALSKTVYPTLIRDFSGIKVGLFGLGIDFDRLVIDAHHVGVSYTDPILAARQAVSTLREAGCVLVICLSHLGYRYRDDRVSDIAIANEVDDIDIILGGHSHTFLDLPEVVTKKNGRRTFVAQAGWGGVRLGRMDVTFNDVSRPVSFQSEHYQIGNSPDWA